MYSKWIRSQAVIVIAFVLLSCCAGSGLWLAARKQAADAWVRHTYDVRENLAQVRISALRSEVHRRSYLMGVHPRAKSTLQESRRALIPALAALRSATFDNPRQHARINVLAQLTVARLDEAQQTVRLVDAGRRAEALAIVDSSRNDHATAALVGVIKQIGAEEQRLLSIRLKRAEGLQRPMLAVLVCCGLLVLLLGLLVWRDRRERMLALHDANQQLEADIVRRELAERELALLAANATDAVLRVGLDGRCLYASPSVRDVVGVDALMLLGQPIGGSVCEADREEMLTFHDLLVSGAIERGVITYRHYRADDPDHELWIEAHSGLVRDPASGEPQEIIASLRDVTDRKQLEHELQAARVHAEAAARAKSSFLANMSHEIRTPMNGVLGFADLLVNSDLAADQRHHAQLIVDSGRAMMRLLNDILDLSKIEAGQMQVSPEPIDLRHALRNCAKLIHPAAMQKGLPLIVDIDEALPPWILLDGLRLRQITLNLLGNAVKFTPAGSIRLSARIAANADGDAFEVQVEDTGIGIPAHRQAAVFEQFTQAEQSTASRFGGTGLGLAISRQLATLMGGRLDLVSDEGVGTTFTLRLPLIEAQPGTITAYPQAAGDSPNRTLRVLVAEDHDVNQALMTAMLGRLGHQGIIAADGLDALQQIVKADQAGAGFDLVLMDMQMPIMDGLEAARKIRAAGLSAARLPILALTANAYSDDVAASLAAGMQAHLTKPVQLADLAAAIQAWTSAPRQSALAAPAFAISPGLQAKFDARKAELATFARALAASEQPDHAAVEQLASLLHKLAGSAAMFNERPLGLRAAELEAELEMSRGSDRAGIIRRVVRVMEDV